MLAAIAKLNVKEGKEEDFERVMLDLVHKVNANEPGCHLYKLCKDADGNYMVLEVYEDEEALITHSQSEHVKASGPGFKGLMGGPPEFTRLDVVKPSCGLVWREASPPHQKVGRADRSSPPPAAQRR